MLREEQRVSKAELARAIDKHPAAIRRLLTASGNPELRTVVAIARGPRRGDEDRAKAPRDAEPDRLRTRPDAAWYRICEFTAANCVEERRREVPHQGDRAGGASECFVEYRSQMMQRGAYPADRAAALSGVPVSTVHWWARHDVLVPSISSQRIKLWSYPDLMGLRIIYWLRQVKQAPDGAAVPRTAMPAVRQALAQLAELDLRLWSEDTGPTVRVDRGGSVFVTSEPDPEAANRQRALDTATDDLLDVTDPFRSVEGSRGPDLLRPRPRLRIVPGKLGGSPHVVHTRLESQALGALSTSGLSEAKIYRLYPNVDPQAINDALDLERQLQQNLQPALAA